MSSLSHAVRVAALSLMLPLFAGTATAAMSEDKGHVYQWNKFTDDLHALHKAQIRGRAVTVKTSTGGYADNPDFYRQEEFFDAASGRLLSVIQWEAAKSEVIHAISVYRHDAEGRVLRDYSSSYLPDYRNAPSQTLVFVHRYNGALHAFRSFDASGDLLYERCEGRLDGQEVFLSLDIDEIEQAQTELYQRKSGLMAQADYKACFRDMPDTADAVLPPH